MKNTAGQTSTKTLIDLYRALDRQHVVTIDYTDSKGEQTLRSIEIHELRTNSDGDILIVAMCRKAAYELAAKTAAGEDTNGETAERQFRLSGIRAYTLHRIAYVLARPEPTTYERPAPAPADDEQALFFYELARDKDDADYQPRVKLTQADTGLAA